MPTPREMAELAASLKLKIQQNKLRLRSAGVATDLPTEMLQALELLEFKFSREGLAAGDEAVNREDATLIPVPQPSAPIKLPSKYLKRLTTRVESTIESALESAMQPWQSELSLATARSVELLKAMQGSITVFAQMEEDYAGRSARLEQQRQQLASEHEKTQSLRWRLSRQRKTLAQAIRAERAEMQLELTKARAAQDQRLAEATDEKWVKAEAELNQLRQQLNAASQQLEQRHTAAKEVSLQFEQQLSEQNSLLQSSLREAEQLRSLVAELRSQLATAQAEVQSHAQSAIERSDSNQQNMEQLQELRRQLSETQEQLLRSVNQLSDYDALLSDKDKQHRELVRQLSEKEQQIAAHGNQLQEALTRSELLQKALSATSNDDEDDGDALGQEKSAQWKAQVEQAEAELADLREQNSELASRIAQLTTDSLSARKGHGPVNPELLSWDERKKLMLQQLEQDNGSDSPDTPGIAAQDKLDIQQIITTTQSEIERRDREIEELREIIQLQSEARQGVAIGAAGVAQMLDNNDLINEERRKLQAIQQEWEAKLRQAEIDLSMERAKLARERSELELELSQLKRTSAQDQNSGSPGDKQQRRWKNFLGLKEESNG